MKWILYGSQLILTVFILLVTYAMARWQASDLVESVQWDIEHGKLKKEVKISRFDELVYVAKHYPSTILIMVLCFSYLALICFLMYRKRP